MITKSEALKGTRGSPNPRYLIVGEAYGATERQQGQPFVGSSGQELTKLLSRAGISEHLCLFTNVVNEQPRYNDIKQFFWPTQEARKRQELQLRGLYPREIVWDGLRKLTALIEHTKPDLIIGFGNYALWALTQNSFKIGNDKGYKIPTGIVNWRGSQIETINGVAFLPTFHPAAALRNWPWIYMIQQDLLRVKHAKAGKWTNAPKYNFIVRPSYETVVAKLHELRDALDRGPMLLSNDLETRWGHIACSGWGWSDREAMCIPFMDQHNPKGYWRFEEELEIIRLQNELYTHPNLILAGQNFLYDTQYIARFWHTIPKISSDTRIMHHQCFPGTPANLNHISSLYCNFHAYWKDEGKTWDEGVDEEQLWAYNCKDCAVTWESASALETVIDYHDLREQYNDGVKQLNIISRMMLRGVRIDKAEQERLAGNLRVVTEEYQDRLERMVPPDLYPRNPKLAAYYSSTKQLGEFLYEVLRLSPVRNRKTGSYTTDDMALEKLIALNPACSEFLSTIQKWRSLRAFDQFATMTTDTDGRMRSMFSPTTETFRWQSSESAFGVGRNLQNIPKGQDE